MTGDIPPPMLVDYICNRLDVLFKEPKQQRWQKAKIVRNGAGQPVAVWSPASGLAPKSHSVMQCRLTDLHQKVHLFQFCQGDDGTVYWAEMPEDDVKAVKLLMD